MEWLRRKVRGILGWDSKLYRVASIFYSDASILRTEGLRTFWKLKRLQAVTRADAAPIGLDFRRLRHPFFVRPGTKDIGTAISNFVREEYGQLKLAAPPLTLIDAGAYIGDTTAYFLSRFPDMYSIALEPHPTSLRLAEQNLAPYGKRVTLLPLALLDTEKTVSFSGAQTGAKIAESEGFEVQTTTIEKLLDRLPDGRANILKMDIEGAENDIFLSRPEKWLPNIDCIIVETHGPDITRNVLAALERNNWRAEQYRNLYYCYPIKK